MQYTKSLVLGHMIEVLAIWIHSTNQSNKQTNWLLSSKVVFDNHTDC